MMMRAWIRRVGGMTLGIMGGMGIMTSSGIEDEPPHSKTLSRERKRLNNREVLEGDGSGRFWNVQESEMRPPW